MGRLDPFFEDTFAFEVSASVARWRAHFVTDFTTRKRSEMVACRLVRMARCSDVRGRCDLR